jgi:hypothetical protein
MQPQREASALSPELILTSARFRVRGKRADCPFCEGHRRLTVSLHGELYYCHRCQRGGNVRGLARSRGLTLPPPRVRKANGPKLAFRAWLAAKMSEMTNRERRLARRAEWAKAALAFYPDHEGAWEALAAWHRSERVFAMFWESASDKCGRYWLYRNWRKRAAGCASTRRRFF